MQGGPGLWKRMSDAPPRSAVLCLTGFLTAALHAQQGSFAVAVDALPDAPGFARSNMGSPQESGGAAGTASVTGTVLDVDGAQISNAFIVLESLHSPDKRTVKSGQDGAFIFTGLPADTYRVTVIAEGFAPFLLPQVISRAGENLQLPQITLAIAPVSTSVNAVFSPYEMAEDEIHVEEKQRVLAVVPNFYVTYNWHAAPLTSGQKFRLALRAEVDPFAFVGAGFAAGIEQASNTFPGYGNGAAGFARRYGAAYGDGFVGTFLGDAVLPSLLHQDPRYFYKGTGSIPSRALYAISTVFICKGDNGKWQPNYSNIIGTLAAAGISNAYYPSTDQDSAGVVVDNALIGLATGAFNSLMQEFVLRRIMLHSAPPPQSAPVATP